MPTLIIDADACPVTREALACARSARVPVLIAGNSTQNLARRIRRDDPRDAEHARGRDTSHPGFWAETLDVSCGADSADFAIIERLQPGDVVVTQDIGLASMVLGRGATAIGVRGHVYNKATIDMQLFIRHEEKKVRRAGGRRGRPPSPTTTASVSSATSPSSCARRSTTKSRYSPSAANTRPQTHATKNSPATITVFSRGWRLVRNSTRYPTPADASRPAMRGAKPSTPSR